ncbi:hypothetical protein ACFYYY_15120 [Streptomyces sp. NPDC001834]|uniref:hypothetical protein n=1 Tax=Streptomyces sp. NPDC001834 TaxID=3364616 RepID=UPI003689973A
MSAPVWAQGNGCRRRPTASGRNRRRAGACHEEERGSFTEEELAKARAKIFDAASGARHTGAA